MEDKDLYKLALELAVKGVDIEKTTTNIWNSIKEIIEPAIELTNKNYKFLSKIKKESELN